MHASALLASAVLALSPFAAAAQAAPASLAASSMAAHTSARKSTASQMVAQTPPMGWNSWNFFHGNVTDRDVRNAADQLVATGMKDAGYVYVNIDDS